MMSDRCEMVHSVQQPLTLTRRRCGIMRGVIKFLQETFLIGNLIRN